MELQSEVTWELRQASAQQAQSCARQARLGCVSWNVDLKEVNFLDF